MVISSRGACIGIGIAFPVIGAALVALRFYMRRHRGLKYQIDDWLNIPSWVFVTGSCICIMHGSVNNYFRDEELGSPDNITPSERKFAQITAALFILWLAANTCIKLSIIFFYRRIFVGKNFNRISWSVVVFLALWTIYSFLSWLLFCGTDINANFEGGWSDCPTWGSRLQLAVYTWDTILDLILLILPIPFVWRLQVNMKKKLLLIFAFLVGGFAFVASLNNTIAQYLYSVKYSYFESGTTTIEGVSGQFLQGVDLVFFNWQTIEVGVGLIASNLTTLRPFWGQAMPNQIVYTFQTSVESSRLLARRMFSKTRTNSAGSRGRDPHSGPTTQIPSWPGSNSYTEATARGAPTNRWSHHVRANSEEVQIPLAHIAASTRRSEEDKGAKTFYESSVEEGRRSGDTGRRYSSSSPARQV